MDSERENDGEELVELLFFSECILLFPVVESMLCLASGGMGGLWHGHLSWVVSAKGPQWSHVPVVGFPQHIPCISQRQDRRGGLCLPLTPQGRSSSPVVSLPAVSCT